MKRSAVHTWKNRLTGKLTNKITIRIERHLSLEELADGLCSAYVRDTPSDELDLPERVSAAKILEAVREEYKAYGENTWSWAEEYGVDDEACREWAKRVIVAAFPEMGENQ